jgi:hypothetical protein
MCSGSEARQTHRDVHARLSVNEGDRGSGKAQAVSWRHVQASGARSLSHATGSTPFAERARITRFVPQGLRQQGLSVRDAVRQAASVRLRPVLMTASVAILGLVPMLLSTGVGVDTQRPLATVGVAACSRRPR